MLARCRADGTPVGGAVRRRRSSDGGQMVVAAFLLRIVGSDAGRQPGHDAAAKTPVNVGLVPDGDETELHGLL